MSALRASTASTLRAARAARSVAPRRLASSSSPSQVAQSAKESAAGAAGAAGAAKASAESAAGNVQEKAVDYAAQAAEYGNKALAAGQKALGPVGARLGNALGAYREPVVYNLSVARELMKQVYVAERLAPPSLGAVQSAYSTLFSRAANPAYWAELINTGGWTKVAVYGLEAYGIYKIGEMIGRRSVVGYTTH